MSNPFDTRLLIGGKRAELLGGSLRVESSADQGTTIAIEIPT
jgi:signal transduction histidine kinase